MPAQVGREIVAGHPGVTHVMGSGGVAVKVRHLIAPGDAGQREHRPMPDRSGDDEREQPSEREEQDADFPDPRPPAFQRRANPDMSHDSPDQVEPGQSDQKPVQPAHAQHGDPVPEREERSQHEVERGDRELQGVGKLPTERIG